MWLKKKQKLGREITAAAGGPGVQTVRPAKCLKPRYWILLLFSGYGVGIPA
jgi:hypothetical protein